MSLNDYNNIKHKNALSVCNSNKRTLKLCRCLLCMLYKRSNFWDWLICIPCVSWIIKKNDSNVIYIYIYMCVSQINSKRIQCAQTINYYSKINVIPFVFQLCNTVHVQNLKPSSEREERACEAFSSSANWWRITRNQRGWSTTIKDHNKARIITYECNVNAFERFLMLCNSHDFSPGPKVAIRHCFLFTHMNYPLMKN